MDNVGGLEVSLPGEVPADGFDRVMAKIVELFETGGKLANILPVGRRVEILLPGDLVDGELVPEKGIGELAELAERLDPDPVEVDEPDKIGIRNGREACLLYTSDAADE